MRSWIIALDIRSKPRPYRRSRGGKIEVKRRKGSFLSHSKAEVQPEYHPLV